MVQLQVRLQLRLSWRLPAAAVVSTSTGAVLGTILAAAAALLVLCTVRFAQCQRGCITPARCDAWRELLCRDCTTMEQAWVHQLGAGR
jgi:hypothetical protein